MHCRALERVRQRVGKATSRFPFFLRGLVERGHDCVGSQQFRQDDTVRRGRAIDRIERNTVALEIFLVVQNHGIGLTPVGLPRGDALCGKSRNDRVVVTHEHLVPLAVQAPVSRDIHEHNLAP